MIVKPQQFKISIGNRQLARGQAMVGQRAQATVRIASCGTCGVQIGDCNCNRGGATSYTSTGAGGSTPGGGGNFTSNPGSPPPCDPGCYPRSACNADGSFAYASYAERLRQSSMHKCPHEDPRWDDMHMQRLLSEPTTVAAGVTADVEVSPVAGTFAAFYWGILAVDPATQVEQVDWRAGTPRIEGCPVPCGSGITNSLAQLVMRVPEACCGHPFVAWLDRRAEDTPLLVSVTNNQAAGDLLFQVELRGYCCSTRIC